MASASDVHSASSGDTHSSYTDEDNSTEDDTWDPIYTSDLDHEWDPAYARGARAGHHDGRTASQPAPRRRRPPVAASEASSSGAPPQIRRPGGARTGPPSSAVSGEDVLGYQAYQQRHMPPFPGRGAFSPQPGYGAYQPPYGAPPGAMIQYPPQGQEFPSNPFQSQRPPQHGYGGYPGSPYGQHPPPGGFHGGELAPYGAQPSPYGYGFPQPDLRQQYFAMYGMYPPGSEGASNVATPAPAKAEPAPAAPAAPAPAPAPAPEPPKIDEETAKKLAAQQEDLEKQQKFLADMKAKEAENLAKMNELQTFINESKAREQKLKDDAERQAEMQKRISEEVAKAKAEMAAAQQAKEIADKQAKYDAEVAAAAAAKLQAEKEAAEAAAKAAYEKGIKDAADVEVAAAKAKAEAEAAEAKAKAEAEVTAAKAEAEAAKAKVPADKKKPIKFKDALGRKFNFPFELCATWKGMNELICQAFMHVEPIGAMVQEGNYDLIGPGGEIILPQIWETVIEPDWTVTMHMWPIKEPPKKEEDGPPQGHGMTGMHIPGRRGGRAPMPGARGGGGVPGRDRPPPPPSHGPGPGPRPGPAPGGPGWIGPLPTGHAGPHPGVEVLPERPKKKKQQPSSFWGWGAPPKKSSKKKST